MSKSYTDATLVLNGVEVASGVTLALQSKGITSTARGTMVTITEAQRPTLAAWTPVQLRGRTRRLCQFCGWTTRDEDHCADNKQHALAHLRAEGIARRFGEGRIPVWGFVVDHLARKGVAVTRDAFGHLLVCDDLRRKTSVGTIRLPAEVRSAVLLTGSGFAESLAWVEASAVEEALVELPAHWEATRERLQHLLAWWRLAESFPAWVAAAAVQEEFAPRVTILDFRRSARGVQREGPSPGYMPSWTRGEYGGELVSPVREQIDAARARLREVR